MLNLNFDSVISGTIADKDGEGTGFTTVQVNTSGSQYAPSFINLDPTTGTLKLTATKGSSTTTFNTLKNALQVALDGTQTFTVSTRISSPLTNLTNSGQQGGLFIGSTQDDYAKLVIVRDNSGLSIRFYKEEGRAGSQLGKITGLNWANIKTLDLYLTGDQVTNTITAAYRINSNTAAPISFSQSFQPSISKRNSFFGSATTNRAGILAFTNTAANVPITFNYFGIAQDVKINFQPSTADVPAGYISDSGEAYTDMRGYGWVQSGTRTPLNITSYARDRAHSSSSNKVDQKLDTLLHMQYSGTSAAAWEYAVPNGVYSVTVSVGDQRDSGGYKSQHSIRVEGVTVIDRFRGTSTQEYKLATTKVSVNDGRLTVDAVGGTNTKINYLEIVNVTPDSHPIITDRSIDADPSTGLVYLDAAVKLDLKLPTVGQGVDSATFTNNVRLYRTRDNSLVLGEINTSGGGDVIVYQPSKPLNKNTNYTFKITNAVRDEAGATFIPYSTTFSTGTQTNPKVVTNSAVRFTKSTVFGDANNGGPPISSLVISPDGTTLYATGLDGYLRRWTINSNGTLSSNMQTFFVGDAIVGLAFDPSDANTLWISVNDSLFPRPAEDFTSKVLKLTLEAGTSFDADVQNYVVNLPRSGKDHLSNSLAFGPDGKLYLSQGSNSAMGAPSAGWYNRSEQLLTASVLQIDPHLTPPEAGFNVQTEDYTTTTGITTTGSYNPYATNAPVKIYATGVRNAYDLVWHSNGQLYAPTNGSAFGGNTPDDPTTTANEALINVGTQNDYLLRLVQDGYYGHPNPRQGNYILNGGNPTALEDTAEVVTKMTSTGEVYAGYPEGTAADLNYQGFAYDFGRNRSPNGVIEYKSNNFGGVLKNKLLVVEYSGGDDILALGPSTEDGNIPSGSVTRIFSGLNNPLDLIEDTRNGNLYIAEMNEAGSNYYSQISLLRAG